MSRSSLRVENSYDLASAFCKAVGVRGLRPALRKPVPAHLTPQHPKVGTWAQLGLREELLYACDVFWDVDADCVVLYFSHPNLPAIFEPA